MGLDIWGWTLAIVAAFAVGLAKGGLSMVGVIAVPLMALVMSPVQAAGILLPVYVASDIGGLVAFRRDFDRRVLATLLPGAVAGIGLGWAIIAAVFLLDLFVSRRAWCSHLCPVGAFYGVIGRGSVVRVSAARRDACTDCGACFNICPEPHVIVPALKGQGSPLILSGDCQNCGGCIDSCPVSVFRMSSRAHGRAPRP